MGSGAHGAIVYRGMGYRGYGPWGLWAMGAEGVWGTGYEQWGTGVWGLLAMGYRGYRVQGVWTTWAMGHMGNDIQGVWGIWAMRPTGGYGHRGYGVQGVWAMWAMGYRGMGNGAHGQFAPKISKRCQVVKKMSSCQKDVKCQKIKHLDYGGGSQKD